MMAEKMKGQYNYQYDTAARAYSSAVPVTRPDTTPVHRPKVAPRKKKDIAVAGMLFGCGIILFASSFFYIGRYAVLNSKQSELKQIKNEMRDLKSTISLTEAKISEKLNLEYIAERASKELGMSLPLAHQIVYIQLPKESYTVYND